MTTIMDWAFLILLFTASLLSVLLAIVGAAVVWLKYFSTRAEKRDRDQASRQYYFV